MMVMKQFRRLARRTQAASAHRFAPCILGATTLLVTAVHRASADSVEDASGVFTNITIVGLEDDRLVFAFNDGRSVQKRVDSLRQISIAAGNDRAADELTRAEALRRAGKRQEAILLYRRVLTLSERPWVQSYARMRLVVLFDEAGDLARAYEEYRALAVDHPRLCERIRPKRIPRADSQVCRRVLGDIERRLSVPQPESVAVALMRLRDAILRRGTSEDEDRNLAPDSTDDDAASPEAMLAVRPPEVAAVMDEIRDTMKKGDGPTTEKMIASFGERFGGAHPDAWIVLQAELALARDEPQRGGLLAMQVVLNERRTLFLPEAIFVAAQSQERLGRIAQAVELYQRCAADPGSPEDYRRRATERLEALTYNETRSASERSQDVTP
jgi:hypothetical protein